MSEPTLHPVKFNLGTVVHWEEWQLRCIPNIKYASKLKIPHLPQLQPHDGKMAIVGAGPSVSDYLDEIRAIKEARDFNNLISVNGAHNWLVKSGVKPRIHIVFEPDLEDVRDALGGDPAEGVTYYIASQCDKKIFRQLEGHNRVIWHAFQPPQEYQQAIHRYFPGEFMVAGGYATFFRAISISVILGFRDFELFGIDCSFKDSSHIDGYAIANVEPRTNVWGSDPRTNRLKKFTTQGGLAFQANEFIELCKHNHDGLSIRVHGDGLLRYLHEARYPEQYQKGP